MLNWSEGNTYTNCKVIKATIGDYECDITTRKKKVPYTRINRLDGMQFLKQQTLVIKKYDSAKSVFVSLECKTFKFGTSIDKVRQYAEEFISKELKK